MKNFTKTIVVTAIIASISTTSVKANPVGNDCCTNSKDSIVTSKSSAKEKYFEQDGVKWRVRYNNKNEVVLVRKDYTEANLNPYIKEKFYQNYSGQKIFGITEFTSEQGLIYIIIAHDNQHWYHYRSDSSGSMSLTDEFEKAN